MTGREGFRPTLRGATETVNDCPAVRRAQRQACPGLQSAITGEIPPRSVRTYTTAVGSQFPLHFLTRLNCLIVRILKCLHRLISQRSLHFLTAPTAIPPACPEGTSQGPRDCYVPSWRTASSTGERCGRYAACSLSTRNCPTSYHPALPASSHGTNCPRAPVPDGMWLSTPH